MNRWLAAKNRIFISSQFFKASVIFVCVCFSNAYSIEGMALFLSKANWLAAVLVKAGGTAFAGYNLGKLYSYIEPVDEQGNSLLSEEERETRRQEIANNFSAAGLIVGACWGLCDLFLEEP
ncbi:MAG: hypothetical protein OXE99_14360 [Cellvibrionales bacterium]|nr:hypothetical protein [Cellvibrionales bacterium]